MSIRVCGADVEFLKFSAGEPHVKVTNIERFVKIIWKFESFEEFIQVAMIADVAKRNDSDVILRMEYVPFSRQDRATTKEQPFSLEIFCNLLRTLKIDTLYVSDVHSDIFKILMSNTDFQINCITQLACLSWVDAFWFPTQTGELQYDCVIAPDKGAAVKAKDIAQYLSCPLICATKVRDPLTGQLSSPTIDFGDLKPKRALIPDDICDGGYTFIQLADVIKQQFPDIKLDLYVTHGIFSRGTEELKKRFESIYVYNNMSKEVL